MMEDSHPPSQHATPIRLPHASHQDASLSNLSAAPPGISSEADAGAFYGSRGFDQMQDLRLLETLGPFSTQQQEDYSTNQDLCHSHPREDEIELPDAGHNTISQYQGHPSQDFSRQHVAEFLQVSTTPAWNPDLAANQPSLTQGIASQRRLLNVPFLTPTRQRNHLSSDEGYYTYQRSQQDTRSERSDRSNNLSHRLDQLQVIPRSFPNQQRPRGYSQGQATTDSMASQQTPTRGSTKPEAGTEATIPCEEENCVWKSRTPSDHKKHMARHRRKYLCEEGECTNGHKRFATVNDLNRHLVSVHHKRIPGYRIYKCFAQGCSRPEKEWPRKDNFRQHLKKAHPNEDIDELTLKSEVWYDTSSQEAGFGGQQDQSLSRHQPHLHETPFLSPTALNSDIGTTAFAPHDNRPQYLYAPREVDQYSNPMPDTPAAFNSRNRLRPTQMTSMGYETNNTSDFNNSTLSATSSGRFNSGGFTVPDQHPSQQLRSHHRASFTGPIPSQDRNDQNRDFDQIPIWAQNYGFHHTAIPMSRTASVIPAGFSLPIQSQAIDQRANTVADFRAQEEERRFDISSDPMDFEDLQTLQDTQYAAHSNILSGVGHNLREDADEDDAYGLSSSTEAVPPPQIRVSDAEQYEQDRGNDHPSAGSDGSVNVDELEKFLQQYTDKPSNNPRVKYVLETALLSLDSKTNPSSAASKTTINLDRFIEEVSNNGGKTAFRCSYPKCPSGSKHWNLRSEVKKHMKRHSRPYGCTFDRCYRQFGSKSDWVRHETKKHALAESWRCMRTSRVAPRLQPCRKVFGTRATFTEHLSAQHNITKDNKPEDLNSDLVKQHISANFQPQYWCGFCKNIIRTAKKGKEAIYERNNHISEHINNDGKFMDDWMPTQGIVSRGQLEAQSLLRKIPREEVDEIEDDTSPIRSMSEGSNSAGSDGSPSPPQVPAQGAAPGKWATIAPQPHTQQPHQQQHRRATLQPSQNLHLEQTQKRTSKRTASDAGLDPLTPPSAPRHHANYWRCDLCQTKNWIELGLVCTNDQCGHQKCKSCHHGYQSVAETRRVRQ